MRTSSLATRLALASIAGAACIAAVVWLSPVESLGLALVCALSWSWFEQSPRR